jgi:hypothetical protein
LFDHPAILAAVKAIEQSTDAGEKVLVFGRFTSPLQTLVELLNARQMLRCLENGQPWPQSKVHTGGWDAVEAAYRQVYLAGTLDRGKIDGQLQKQYDKLENEREEFRAQLIERIEEGLATQRLSPRALRLFDAFRESVAASSANTATTGKPGALAIIARALQSLTGLQADPAELVKAFAELIDAASDRDAGTSDVGDDVDASEDRDTDGDAHSAAEQWQILEARLADEYGRPEGGFARLMYGKTEPNTRRLLQLAFNRTHSNPRVLVAQSLVGREGLNLHQACRTVVLLHPEWNPGVVEQQIGRVDRLGSLWEQQARQAICEGKPAAEFPRILVRPVVFRGTYDEKNWEVLRARWDDLRAQLHGEVISPRLAADFPDMEAVIDEINASAPNFSPLTAERREGSTEDGVLADPRLPRDEEPATETIAR